MHLYALLGFQCLSPSSTTFWSVSSSWLGSYTPRKKQTLSRSHNKKDRNAKRGVFMYSDEPWMFCDKSCKYSPSLQPQPTTKAGPKQRVFMTRKILSAALLSLAAVLEISPSPSHAMLKPTPAAAAIPVSSQHRKMTVVKIQHRPLAMAHAPPVVPPKSTSTIKRPAPKPPAPSVVSSEVISPDEPALEGEGFERTAKRAFRFAIRENIKFFKETVEDFTHHMKPEVLESLVLLLASMMIVPLMKRLNTSSILGFLMAGVILGPKGLKVVGNVSGSSTLAELGVVFFLFEMGLELSIAKLRALGKDVFGLGSLQFLATGLLLCLIGTAAGIPTATSLILGGALALSSSAFVLQLLAERGEMGTRFGRASFGILLFQDLAVVPLLVMTPLLATGGSGATLARAMAAAGAKGVLALGIIIAAGKLLLQPTFRFVAKAKSQEAFFATILFVILATSTLTEGLGLSDTLGAFLAGVMLAETSYSHQVEADIKPFRGLLLGLFFITVGFSIDLQLLMANLGVVSSLVFGMILLKTGIISALGVLFGMSFPSSMRTGLILAQGGEFAFVVFGLAVRYGVLPQDLGKLLLLVVALSMACTPALASAGQFISLRLGKERGLIGVRKQDADTAEMTDYVVVAGFGRVGQSICEMLDMRLIRHIAFDLSPQRVLEARQKGLPVLFGDACRPDVLRTGGVEKANAVVVTLDDPEASLKAVTAIKREFPNLSVFCRAIDIKHQKLIQLAGGIAVIPEVLEASLLLGGAVLRTYGIPEEEVNTIIDKARAKQFADEGVELHQRMDGGVESSRGGVASSGSTVFTTGVQSADVVTVAEKQTDDGDKTGIISPAKDADPANDGSYRETPT